MSSWTIVARCADKPPERGLVAVDLTIDGGDPLTLRLFEAEGLESALGNALTGINAESGRISCVNVGVQIVIAVDKTAIASLVYSKAELMRSQLKELLAGRGTEFSDSGAVE
ncbi:conserved hypothetical protein [Nitrobacter hamburgensis X14]|uniref:Uncharacterized protein n=1 Tax=Nitrobacter hamburgensis (strain DSM 10229 / NCIMB 13809 / X14) TaxID=323097 RepID=Q1QKI2_NITHX|nr:hypothetical protein [Nitrobacter hamburgensis]ABE63265.1 conserved hypothetical protein [Nitrobacter hamburgensis X14]